MLYGLNQFPTLDPNDRRLLIVPLIVLTVAWALVIAYRKTLMPWGNRAPALMWGGTLAAAALPAMASVAVILVTNGALDRSPAQEVRAEIVQRNGRPKSVIVVSSSWPGLRIAVDVTPAEFEDLEIGDSLRLKVAPGALGIPWIVAHASIDGAVPPQWTQR